MPGVGVAAHVAVVSVPAEVQAWAIPALLPPGADSGADNVAFADEWKGFADPHLARMGFAAIGHDHTPG
jgi:hypothetical protein